MGFNSRSARQDSEEYYTFVFNKNGKAYEANIRNVAKQRNFHGSEELEKAFSSQESGQAVLVNRLCLGVIAAKDTPEIASTIASLLVRTRNLRKGFAEGGKIVFQTIAELIPGKEYQNKIRPTIIEEVYKSLEARGILQAIRSLPSNERLVLETKMEHFLQTCDLGKLTEPLLPYLREMSFEELAVTAHNRSLQQAPRRTPLIEYLESLDWRIISSNSEPFILGDGILIGWCERKGFLHPLNSGLKDLNIILPLSRDKAVVGESAHKMMFSSAELNAAAAQLSLEFFISSENGEPENKYQKIIGENADFVRADDLRVDLLSK